MSPNIRLTILSGSAARGRGKMHLDAPTTVYIRGTHGDDYVCGSCGATLLEQVDRLTLRNAALRCNACRTYNDAGKPCVHSSPPTTLKTLADLPAQRSHFRVFSFWANGEHSTEMLTAHRTLDDRWHEVQGDRPKVLFHYSSTVGLKGILAKAGLWASDMAYLNDSTEMQLGLDIIAECSTELEPSLSPLGRELVKRAGPSLSPEGASGFLVACFCQNGDLLSQWRGYGANGGGYAIGFSANQLATDGQSLLRRVVYDSNTQRQLVRGTIQTACQLLDAIAIGRSIAELDRLEILPRMAGFLSDHLTEYVFTFKHSSFSEESEWRLIVPYSGDEHLDQLLFRETKGLLVPFVEHSLGAPRTSPASLPIVEVVHGPSLNPGLTNKALHLLLRQHHYEHVEVRPSAVPLRA